MAYGGDEWDAMQREARGGEDNGRQEKRRTNYTEWGTNDPGDPEHVIPVDLWDVLLPPELPQGLLPPVIENYARSQGRLMGADPAGVAMGGLCVAAAALTDQIMLQPHVNNPGWQESARIWVALVGDISDKKTPIIKAVTGPLAAIDMDLFKAWCAAMETFEKQTREEKRDGPPPPKSERTMLGDTSVEAAEEALVGSPAGLMVCHDELAGWFGSMERYSSSSDRPFWLEAYNGGRRASNRIKRGSKIIPNISACILGGIQPDKMREIARDATDDGLLQRLLPTLLREGMISRDEPQGSETQRYKELIRQLFEMRRNRADFVVNTKLRFSDEAQQIFYAAQQENDGFKSLKVINRKVASALLKGDGLIARLCVLFHCIENATGHMLPFEISADTTGRVVAFVRDFIRPHQIAFLAGLLVLSEDYEELRHIANYILAHELKTVTNRVVERGIRRQFKLDNRNIQNLFQQLYALGWLLSVESKRANDPGTWTVNPAVHKLFAERAQTETKRRLEAREMMRRAGKGGK